MATCHAYTTHRPYTHTHTIDVISEVDIHTRTAVSINEAKTDLFVDYLPIAYPIIPLTHLPTSATLIMVISNINGCLRQFVRISNILRIIHSDHTSRCHEESDHIDSSSQTKTPNSGTLIRFLQPRRQDRLKPATRRQEGFERSPHYYFALRYEIPCRGRRDFGVNECRSLLIGVAGRRG